MITRLASSGLPRAAVLGTLLLCAAAPAALAADWSATNVQILHGNQYERGQRSRTILTLEHASGWGYGDNFFFVDIAQPDSASTELYGEFAPRLSLGKLSGQTLALGPVKDLLLAAQINNGNNFRAYLYGIGMDLALPGFRYAAVNLYVRDDASLPGSGWQMTAVGSVPFSIFGTSWAVEGFADWAGTEGEGAMRSRANLLVVPQLRLDLGALWDAPGRLEAGIEYSYWRRKFGIDGVDERVVQSLLKWTL